MKLLVCLVALVGCKSSGSTATASSPGPEPSASTAPKLEPHHIGLAGYQFDPLEYDIALPTDRQVPRDACAGRPCHYLVQFGRALLGPEQEMFKQEHRLALDRYVPNLAYIEYLEPDQAGGLCENDLVRACMPFQPAFRIPKGGIHIASGEPQELIATLFDEADLDTVRGHMAAAGAQILNTRDDRPIGGSQRIMFRLPEPGDLDRLGQIEGLQWIEMAPRINEDG